MRRSLAAGLVTAGLALSACGGSTKVVTDTQPAASTSSATSTTPASSGASSTSVTSSSSASAPGVSTARCVASDLALTVLGQQGAAGHGELGFALRNTSAHSCHTFGYPGILFLSRSGGALATVSTRTTHDFFGSTTASPLIIAPGSSASFRVGVTHGISSSAGCATAAALQAIAPDDTATLRVTIPGGAYECGSATVSPLQAGNAAYR